MTFSDPIVKAQELSDLLRPTNDVVIALTHIGFTENPASVEVDANVDTNLVANRRSGCGHRRAQPYRSRHRLWRLQVPADLLSLDPNGMPVIINQAYRYNNTLGEIFIGLRAKAGGGYEVVSQAGQYIYCVSASTAEDAAIKAIVDPYVAPVDHL